MTTFAIGEAKIKLRWREKYLTDGENERTLAIPRGAYRGYWPAPRLVPDTFLRLLRDPYTPGHSVDKDQFLIYRHSNDGTGVGGFCVSIREVGDIEFDCADLFPVGGVAEDWYVYVEAAYTPNTTTTANYRVMKTDPHDPLSPNYEPDAVILAVIPMTAGLIAFPAFTPLDPIYARRSIPSPTARQAVADYVDGDEPWGLFDGLSRWCLGTGAEARAFAEPVVKTVAGLAAAVKFQLTGTFYVGNGGITTPGKHFRLMNTNVTFNMPLVGSDTGQWLSHVQMYQSDGVTDLNPSVDADAEGFYTNPWVRLNGVNTVDATYTGSLRVLCYEKKTLLTLENAPAGAFPLGDIETIGHTANIVAKAHAGTPDSLAAGMLDTQLTDLIGFVDERIKTIHPTAAPANWTLLWRSHNITADANVAKNTNSIYFNNGSFIVLVGGYIVPGTFNVCAGLAADTRDVLMQWFGNNWIFAGSAILTGVKDNPVAGAVWSMITDWDSVILQTQTGTLYNQKILLGGEEDSYIEGDGTNLVKRYPLFQSPSSAGVVRTRIYYGDEILSLSSNCAWDNATSKWVADVDDGSDDASVITFGNLGRIYIHKKSRADVIGTPWGDNSAGWTTTYTFGDPGGADARSALACMRVDGYLYEYIRFGWAGNTGLSDFDPDDFYMTDRCNFRNMRLFSPDGGDFTIDTTYRNAIEGGGWFSVVLPGAILDIDQWGFSVQDIATIDTSISRYYDYDALMLVESD